MDTLDKILQKYSADAVETFLGGVGLFVLIWLYNFQLPKELFEVSAVERVLFIFIFAFVLGKAMHDLGWFLTKLSVKSVYKELLPKESKDNVPSAFSRSRLLNDTGNILTPEILKFVEGNILIEQKLESLYNARIFWNTTFGMFFTIFVCALLQAWFASGSWLAVLLLCVTLLFTRFASVSAKVEHSEFFVECGTLFHRNQGK